MKATVYMRPNGRTEEIYVEEINSEDREWFEENEVVISMEDCGVFKAIYAIHPDIMFEDEPDEQTYIVRDKEDCKTAMSNVRKMLEKLL